MKPKIKTYHITGKNITFNLPKIRDVVTVGRGKHAYKMLELYCGFDIETTNINQVDSDFYGWHAYAYHMQLSIHTKYEKYNYLFRYWDLVEWFIDHMADVYQTGPDLHMLVWIANFSFEFQFIRKRFKWDQGEFDFFAKEERQPLRATYRGIEFREALSISGGSLAQLAKDYCTTQKLVTYDEKGNKISDLDYSIERNSETPLSPDKEEPYCINDVVILSEFSEYIFKNHIRPDHNIPMTKTSILLQQFKKQFSDLCKKRDIKNHIPRQISEMEYKDYILACFPHYDEYVTWMKYLFRGGYVHANATYAGLTLPVKKKDITSHYPARMNLDYFPKTPFKSVSLPNGLLTPALLKFMKTKCCIMHCYIDFIEATTEHSIESKNKIIQAFGAKWDNGRLQSADMIEVYLTELDYDTYTKFYKWASITVLSFQISERGKQPPFVLEVLNSLYKEKNILKKTGQNHTTEYAIKKAGVNSCYGAEVKRIRTEQTKYNFETNVWYTTQNITDFEKERQKQLLLPQMGIWVTAHARHEILHIIYKLTKAGVHVYYCDTDSITHEPSHKAEEIFKHYNRHIARRRKKRGLRNENFNDLGEFDPECKNQIVNFKTLGSKRYIYEFDNKVIATVAGMPKQAINMIGKTAAEIFKNFSLSGFELTPEDSGKLTTRYNDYEHTAIIQGVKMHELSSVALFKIPFKITITDEYQNIIKERKQQACKL